MTRRPRTTVNRISLAACGLAMTLGGGWLTTAATPVARHLPADWPEPAAGSVLLDRAGLSTLRHHGWWTPAVITVGVVTTLLLVALWLFSQLRVHGRSRLPLAAPGGLLSTKALEKALSERTAAVNGVARCRIRIHARRRLLELQIHAWLTPGTAPGAVLHALTAVTAEAEHSAAPYRVEPRIRFGHQTHRMPHVR